jgi:hypothetical protein
MRLSSHGPRARAEFRRLVLESRIGVTEAELAARRSRRQRLRARRVERRLIELRSRLRELNGEEPELIATRSWGPVYLVSAAWLVGATLLATELVRNGLHTVAATVGNIVMLALSLLWFAVVVARVPVTRSDRSSRPEQRG